MIGSRFEEGSREVEGAGRPTPATTQLCPLFTAVNSPPLRSVLPPLTYSLQQLIQNTVYFSGYGFVLCLQLL